jgi:hypothetical protein
MQPKMIRVDQALHGYSRGHKELASSVELDERSRTTMLMMSDLLAVMDLLPDESYLTVYPLKSASRHVIARTWAAGRNYRPGSVWTHSLILDYQALTLLTDLLGLLSHFEMPVEGAIRTYGKPLEIDANERSDIYVGPDDRIPAAVRQLYGLDPQQQVALPHLTAERDEVLMLAIWRQMWPGMRRDFSALTNLGDGTVRFESGCTLRFMRHAPPVEDEPSPSIEEGLRELEADLPKPGPTPLRSFLGRYAIEAQEPRRLAAALATSWADEGLPADVRLERLRGLTGGASLPRFVRDLLTQEFARVDNATNLLSLVRSSRNETVDIDLTAPLKLASAMSLDDLGYLIASTGPSAPDELGARLYAELIKNLPVDRLVRVANGDERLRMAEIRPELLRVPYFWPPDDVSRAAMVEELAPGALSFPDALDIFGPSIGVRTVSALINHAVDLAPDMAVSLFKVDESAVRDEIAAWVLSSPDRLRSIADRQNDLDRRAIETLAGAQLGRGELPSDPESWARLIESAIGDVPSRSGALNVIGYLSSLALSGNEALSVAKTVFDTLHSAVRSHTLSRVEEHYLSKSICSYSRSWLLSKALVQSALSKWPVTPIQAGAFSITQSEFVQDEIIDEIVMKNGKQNLWGMLQSPYLSESARARIQHRLMPPKSKKDDRPWSWLFDK